MNIRRRCDVWGLLSRLDHTNEETWRPVDVGSVCRAVENAEKNAETAIE